MVIYPAYLTPSASAQPTHVTLTHLGAVKRSEDSDKEIQYFQYSPVAIFVSRKQLEDVLLVPHERLCGRLFLQDKAKSVLLEALDLLGYALTL